MSDTHVDTTTRIEIVHPSDARVQPVLEDLVREYSSRYGDIEGHNSRAEVYTGLENYTEERGGTFLILLDGDEVLASGAGKRIDAETIEFKKIWTNPDRRGERLGSRLLAKLEDAARDLGYRKVYLTTGPRQPEADRLYERNGYTAHFSPGANTVHPYTKALVDGVDGTTLPAGFDPVSQSFDELVGMKRPEADASGSVREAAAPGRRGEDAPENGRDQADGGRPVADQATQSQPNREHKPARRVIRRRSYARWIFAAIAIFLVAQFVVSLFKNPNWHWDVFAEYVLSKAIVDGVLLTLALTAISAVIGFVLGAVLAVMKMSDSPILQSFASGYIWFFRAVPLVVQLVVWYNLGYLWPTLGFGTPFTTNFWIYEFNTVTLISAFAAAILGLSLHEAAYSAEIIRGGLLSVDQGQLEASRALGLPRATRFFRIVLPQALRSIVPNAFNSVIGLVKGTSVVFIVALPELFYTAQVIYNRNQMVIPLLLVTVAWYAVITTALNIAQFYIERHYAKGHERELPPTPLQRIRRWFAARRPDPVPTPASGPPTASATPASPTPASEPAASEPALASAPSR
ncbi:ABC transporter permease subunit [Gulosibacter molinativorax]|uniref:GNAT family N-acetyltransferase n=1 Tax=Gulosibacter molinativorax TaxID=256821 RepID=A0ABT7C3X1_9MICO|nr:ABC transporter permease subunit [Gulosibacter molinativorax]MDJ1369921.1 GNAT family N-acetyltransferase [Gulosibacter molinativorax]QUY61890.1 Inner membrane amino-acid ABC transporter permease protein YecS [Gulosibacter molinativorax]